MISEFEKISFESVSNDSKFINGVKLIELRSDTFTKPSKEMLEAMFSAEVGDDVFEEDPTTARLEKKAAKIFGYEAGLFCVSGTMANQIAINIHVKAGDEVICDRLSHIYLYEGGGIAANSQASAELLVGDRGRISAAQIEEVIKENNVYCPISKLVSLENTVNKGGGSIYQFTELERIKHICLKHGLMLHLDGARLFNALVETGENALMYGKIFDSISICLSKGLGTPVGSVLMGSSEFIKSARRVRKRFGGGWRQSGYLAAAGIFALDNNILRLKDDHIMARELGAILKNKTEVYEVLPVDTNIVIFKLEKGLSAGDYVKHLALKGILAAPFGKDLVRMVTHLDFTEDDLAEFRTRIKT